MEFSKFFIENKCEELMYIIPAVPNCSLLNLNINSVMSMVMPLIKEENDEDNDNVFDLSRYVPFCVPLTRKHDLSYKLDFIMFVKSCMKNPDNFGAKSIRCAMKLMLKDPVKICRDIQVPITAPNCAYYKVDNETRKSLRHSASVKIYTPTEVSEFINAHEAELVSAYNSGDYGKIRSSYFAVTVTGLQARKHVRSYVGIDISFTISPLRIYVPSSEEEFVKNFKLPCPWRINMSSPQTVVDYLAHLEKFDICNLNKDAKEKKDAIIGFKRPGEFDENLLKTYFNWHFVSGMDNFGRVLLVKIVELDMRKTGVSFKNYSENKNRYFDKAPSGDELCMIGRQSIDFPRVLTDIVKISNYTSDPGDRSVNAFIDVHESIEKFSEEAKRKLDFYEFLDIILRYTTEVATQERIVPMEVPGSYFLSGVYLILRRRLLTDPGEFLDESYGNILNDMAKQLMN